MKDRIRMLMQKAGMTQKDFANCLQISEASLSSIFNGRTNPTNTHVCAVHKAFPNVNVNWLLFGEGEIFTDGSGDSADDPAFLKPTLPSAAVLSESQVDEPLVGAPPHRSEIINIEIPGAAMHPHGAIETESKGEKKCDKRVRSVKEIRIFYDDGTYEIFIPAVK